MIVIVGLIAVVIALALVVTVFSVIVAVLAASVAVGFAGLTGVAAGMLATAAGEGAGVPEPQLVGTAVGIIVFLMVAALLLRRMFGKRARAAEAFSKMAAVKGRGLNPQTEPAAEPLERDAAVRAAWDRAQRLVPKAALAHVARARGDCAALLDMADGDTFDPGVIDLAALVRRNVPALVQQLEALSRNATRAEQAELAQGLADDLIRLGTAAHPYADQQRQTLRDGLAALRNHVAARTRG